MKVKKTVAVLMSMAVLFGTAACSGTTENKAKTTDTKTGKSSSAAATSVQKPTVIKAYMDAGIVKESQGQKQFVDEFQKETGIKLDVTQPNHNEYMQKLKMAFASGEAPDVVEINNDDMVQFANNGALYDITNFVQKSATFQNILKDQDAKNLFEILKVNGKLYACPEEKGTGVVTYMRKDLLDKAGLKIPTTYDEFINVLRAFSKMKTSTGKAIIPYTAPGIDPVSQNYLPQFYQTTTGGFERGSDGKWIDGFTTPAMKDTLTKMRNAYKEGLLDKEIVTNKTSTCRDKWGAGQVGTFSYWTGAWAVTLSDKVKKSVPGANVVAIPAIQGTKYSCRVPATLAINSKAKNPEGIFKYMFEYIHDGKDGTMLWTHGVKDVHYKVTSGKYEALPCLDDPKTLFTRAIVDIGMNLEPNYKDPFNVDSRLTASNKVLEQAKENSKLCPPANSYYKNGGSLVTLRSQITAKIVVNGTPVDDGINQYKSQSATNVTAILNEFNSKK